MGRLRSQVVPAALGASSPNRHALADVAALQLRKDDVDSVGTLRASIDAVRLFPRVVESAQNARARGVGAAYDHMQAAGSLARRTAAEYVIAFGEPETIEPHEGASTPAPF